MKNLDIRMLVSEKGLKYKDIAKKLGISREWLCRLMRTDLSVNNKIRILKAIKSMTERGENYDADNQ